MIGKWFDKILHEDEFEKGVKKKKRKKSKIRAGLKKGDWLAALVVFLIALAPRLWFLLSHDPQNPGYGWYGDVYHRWQIAYLSMTVGFKQGFLRLWDFKGMEFFWGLLHPLMTIWLFKLTSSISIILPRLLSIGTGALVVAFIYLLVKRDFNKQAAWAAALWLSFFPVIMFSDSIGMQEPLGLALILGGILAWPRYGFLTGLVWGLSAMVRAEYWLFTGVLLLVVLKNKAQRGRSGSKAGLVFGWLVVILFYMKYLANWTGNYIYPIYWNFLASVVGKWFYKEDVPILPYEYALEVKIGGIIVLLLVGLAVIWLLRRRRKYNLWLLIGFFNLGLIGFMFSLAAYSWGYIDRFLVDRLFAWPYGFSGILLSIFLLYVLPKKFKLWGQLRLGWLAWLVVLASSMLMWKPINYYFEIAQEPWPWAIELAEKTSQYWDKKGKIGVPANQPDYVYALVSREGVKGEQIIGQMFDPFYYIEDDPFDNWEENWIKMKKWLEDEDISLFVISKSRSDYMEMLRRQPDDFRLIDEEAGRIFVQPSWRK